jgi:nucleotide-binding universal stress UspA family protein
MSETFKKILLALSDDVEEATQVAKYGLALADTHEAEVRILSVLTPALAPTSPSLRFAAADTPIMSVAQVSEPAIQNRKAMIEKILELQAPKIKKDQTVRAGDPAMGIVSEADSWGADLIVLGSRDRSWLERLFDPSVSRAVAQRAECAVLILPVKV